MRPILVLVILTLGYPALGANAAVQTPPQCMLTDTPPCTLGWKTGTGWQKQVPQTIPPAITIQGGGEVIVSGGPPNPYVISAPTDATGGGLAPVTYTGSIAPNTWYGLYDPVPASITLPPAGTAPFTNPNTIVCFSIYGTTSTTFNSSSQIYGSVASLQPGAAPACFGVDDKTPAGWRGDGG